MIFALDELTGRVIVLCWVIFLVVWAVTALFVKRTVERHFGWWLPALVAVMVVYPVVRRITALWQERWPQTAAIGVLADLLTVAGGNVDLGKGFGSQLMFDGVHGHVLLNYTYGRHVFSFLLVRFRDPGVSYSISF